MMPEPVPDVPTRDEGAGRPNEVRESRGVASGARPAAMSRGIVLTAICVPLIVLKLLFNPFPYSDVKTDDGAYYYQIAKHVANGDGVVTSVSLNHSGLRYLPHPVTFYPLWPLVLGMTGRLVGLPIAAHLLPEGLYFVALGLLYVLANRVASTFGSRGDVLLDSPIEFTAGHAAVLLFGFNHVFFRFTSLPFTEGLAWVLSLGAILMTGRIVQSSAKTVAAALAGVLAGLAFLTRAQCIGLTLAIPCSILIAGLSGRREYRRAAAAAFCGAWIVVLAWSIQMFTTLEHPNVRLLVDNTAIRETVELSPYSVLVRTSSPLEYVKDRAGGLYVAFNLRSTFSYVRSFGLVVYVVPLGLLFAVVRRWRLESAWQEVTDPRALIVVTTAIAGVLCLGPVHLKHVARFGGWSFQFRDGLPIILPIIVGVPYVAARGRLMRTVAILCVAMSLVASVPRMWTVFAERYPEPSDAQRALAEWIEQQPRAPVFLSTRPSVLAAATGGLFYMAICNDDADDTRVYVERLHVDYLLTFADDQACPFFTGSRALWTAVRSFDPSGPGEITVWKPNR